MNISNYKVLEKITETRSSIIYRGQKDSDNGTVIVKELKTKYPNCPTASEIARFKQEYELIKNLDIDGVVKVFDIIQDGNNFAIIQEQVEGVSLDQFLCDNKLDLRSFLKIALALSNTLGVIHKKNIIHKDIKPHNIIIDPDNGLVKVTNFGIEKELVHTQENVYHPDVIEETLPYLSPEQTGRMNRAVDYRTDLYSLGVTFYEMLIKELPFRSEDPMELIHSHIAKMPPSPIELNSNIPRVLSDIVMKLLSKMAEERYQNGFGLMVDLEKCLKQLTDVGTVESFPLGDKDISVKFNIPQKLFGRGKEIAILMSTFDRLSEGQETSRIMFVSGNPGIGKSTLINEIHKPILAKRGYFITGKYDQFRKDVPYSSIIQAFQGLVKNILSESDARINYWKEEILKAINPNGRIITDVIPVVELIIGKQPDIPELGPEQSHNRFNLVFKNFVSIFATREHPLVIFLDDLQWVDLASLALIQAIITDPDIKFLFLIGAYRDNEVSVTHPLLGTIEEIKKEGVSIQTIAVTPLSAASVNELVMNCLRCTVDRSQQLADIIYQKTNGNPFFVNQFLKTLYDEHLIEQNPVIGWSWDINEIKKLRVTDNVVEMMAGKITRLPKGTMELLTVGACIGNRFDMETLAHIMGKTVDETLNLLVKAIDEGMIYLEGDLYKFYHDRIQEAAYSLLSDNEKSELHYSIGKLVLANTRDEELDKKIMYIVNQLNSGSVLIASEDEKYQLSGLNLKAGKKAKLSTAYSSAFVYFSKGISLMADDCWEKQYDLALCLHTEAAEAAYLSINYDQMEQLSNVVLNHSRSILDKVRIYEINVQTYMAQYKLKEAIDTGLEILKNMGVRFPKKPTLLHAVLGLVGTKIALWGKQIEKLIDLPEMKDPYALAKARILSSVATSAYYAAPELFPLIIFKGINLAVKYGNAFTAPFGYAGYGIILCNIGEIDSGYRFGKLALNLLEKMNIKESKAKTHFVVNAFIRHWKEHVRAILKPLIDSYHIALENGDLEFAGHSIFTYTYLLLDSGIELDWMDREINKYHEAIVKLKQDTPLNGIKIVYQSALNLMGKSENPSILIGSVFNEEKMLPVYRATNKHIALANVYFCKMVLSYLFQDYDNAFEYAKISLNKMKGTVGSFANPVFFFDYSLVQLSLYQKSSKKEQKIFLQNIKINQKKLKKWAHYAPMNHLHKYQLVEAEIARVKGNDITAMDLYDKAIQGAHDNEYLQEEALANELAAKFYLSLGKNKIAITYMTYAYDCYYKWGAMAKVKHLEENYPQLLMSVAQHEKKSRDASKGVDTDTTSTGRTSETLDLSTVMKSSQTLSSEIDLSKLLETLMKLSIENAGAQKGFLVLEKEQDKNLYIEAEGDVETGIKVLQSIPVEQRANLSSAIVNYVSKTKEAVVLNDACHEGIFTNDGYVISNRPKSILCIPITHKGTMAGILYLENNLTTNAFTPERLELLRILSSQAAISIENARLLVHRENAAKLQMEMQIAQRIQTSLLPKDPRISGFEISAYMKPTDEVGGDYYDIINVAGRDWIVIGDVSGHGVPAGLVMMMVQTAIRVTLDQHADLPPSEVLERINKTITYNIQQLSEYKYMTITVFAAHENGKFVFSGLHQDIMIYRAETREVELVGTEGMWIGIMENIQGMVKDESLTLHPGDTLLIYTDGITEAWKKNGNKEGRGAPKEMFGENKLKEIFCKLGEHSPQEIQNGILLSLSDYDCRDDVTMVVVKRKG